jgi:hypothetical protein
LLANDNDPEAVQTLADELTAAIETGDPLTRTEILARIEELGLTLPTSTTHSDDCTNEYSDRRSGQHARQPQTVFRADLADDSIREMRFLRLSRWKVDTDGSRRNGHSANVGYFPTREQ